MLTTIRFQRIPDTLKQGGDSRTVFYPADGRGGYSPDPSKSANALRRASHPRGPRQS